ncbi:hypothetical protein CEXT_539681 [Caerostris extrusa]|uniref:Uncharacterized protein n=1 Tax=Caerostris extrusa TaxID=172846 RepID=A0AAV4W320_CAEEX|nr:hypothetical protein CEXT_539681 [Caerostris extrusa]
MQIRVPTPDGLGERLPGNKSFWVPGEMSPVSLFFATTSPCREWVIYAPSAFLGCGSSFSGSLSESHPDSPLPVTTMVGAEPTIDT